VTEPAALPRRFGRYALFDFIGRGGMAEIYLARAESEFGAARLCVLKEILPQYASDASFAELLIFEAKLAARLSHANIVQVFDLGRFEDRLYIAMEYVEGYDLTALLKLCTAKRAALPLAYAIHIVSEVLRGLDYAHRAKDDNGALLGVVHRDVSPSNILISRDGEIKLCDFGIAHANDLVATDANVQHAEATQGEMLRGKAGYMSPEHAHGERLDARADVFAVGIVLWELLAGKRMYRAEEGVPLIEIARRANIPELPERDLPEPGQLRDIVTKALARSREDRFASAAAMRLALDDYLNAAKLTQNSIHFGDWLNESFGDEAFRVRRAKEQTLTPAPVAPARASAANIAGTSEVQAEAVRALPAVGFGAPNAPPAQREAVAVDAVLQEVTEPLGMDHFRGLGRGSASAPEARLPVPIRVPAAGAPGAASGSAEVTAGPSADPHADSFSAAKPPSFGAAADLAAAESDSPRAQVVIEVSPVLQLPQYRGPVQSAGAMRAFRETLSAEQASESVQILLGGEPVATVAEEAAPLSNLQRSPAPRSSPRRWLLGAIGLAIVVAVTTLLAMRR
jgi:eukaryotic-like serine/threonine-protein kinase